MLELPDRGVIDKSLLGVINGIWNEYFNQFRVSLAATYLTAKEGTLIA